MVIVLLIHLLIERSWKMKEDNESVNLVATEYMKDLFLCGVDKIAYLITYRCDIVLSKELELFLALHVN